MVHSSMTKGKGRNFWKEQGIPGIPGIPLFLGWFGAEEKEGVEGISKEFLQVPPKP
jgi:hypothetical protein